jgi:hypothetical protein
MDSATKTLPVLDLTPAGLGEVPIAARHPGGDARNWSEFQQAMADGQSVKATDRRNVMLRFYDAWDQEGFPKGSIRRTERITVTALECYSPWNGCWSNFMLSDLVARRYRHTGGMTAAFTLDQIDS